MKKLLIILFLLIPVDSWGNTSETLFNAKTLKCKFTVGGNGFWENGKLTYAKKRKETWGFFISEIDKKNQTAKIIGNAGSEDLIMLSQGPKGFTFIEITSTGNLAFTTVFKNLAKTNDGIDHFIAVHTRHMEIIEPMPSQSHGTCEAIK